MKIGTYLSKHKKQRFLFILMIRSSSSLFLFFQYLSMLFLISFSQHYLSFPFSSQETGNSHSHCRRLACKFLKYHSDSSHSYSPLSFSPHSSLQSHSSSLQFFLLILLSRISGTLCTSHSLREFHGTLCLDFDGTLRLSFDATLHLGFNGTLHRGFIILFTGVS